MGEGGESMVTVTFEERDATTTVRTRMDFGSGEARDAAMATGMTDGMEISYQHLDELVIEEGQTVQGQAVQGPAGEGPEGDDVRAERRGA